MSNRNPDSPDFESDDNLDDIVHVVGTVKELYYGKLEFGEDSLDQAYLFCAIDTEFGPLEIVHTVEQVREEQRKNLKEGAVVAFYGVISGDVAINEYEEGIIRDEEHDLAALRSVFSGNDPERIRSILSEECVYVAYYSNSGIYVGPDEIIDRIKYVTEDRTGETIYAHMATIASIDEGETELLFEVGKRCLVIAYNDEEAYDTLAFIDLDKDGNISRIVTDPEPRYHFRLDKVHRKSILDELDGVSLADLMINRARFWHFIDEDVTNEMVLEDDEEDDIYEDAARRMLELMPDAEGNEKENLMKNLFGYLFAKAAETEYLNNLPGEQYGPLYLRGGVNYLPKDVWNGEIHSTNDQNLQEKLESMMEKGRLFYSVL